MATNTTDKSLGLIKYPKEIADQLIAKKFTLIEPIKPVYPKTTLDNIINDYSIKQTNVTNSAKTQIAELTKKINEVDQPTLDAIRQQQDHYHRQHKDCGYLRNGIKCSTTQSRYDDFAGRYARQLDFVNKERERLRIMPLTAKSDINLLIEESKNLRGGITEQYNTELKNYNDIYMPAWNKLSKDWDEAERIRVNGVLMKYNTDQAKFISDSNIESANIESNALLDKITAHKAGLSDDLISGKPTNNTPYIVAGVIAVAIAVTVALKSKS